MITFKAEYTNLETNKKETVEYKTSSSLKMKILVSSLLDKYIFIEDWLMMKYLPKIDRWGDRLEWEMGNEGMNAGAYLSEEIEKL